MLIVHHSTLEAAITETGERIRFKVTLLSSAVVNMYSVMRRFSAVQ